MNSFAATSASWHPAKKVLFRFCFVYFAIYCFPFPLDAFEFTKPFVQPFYNLVDRIIPYLAAKWFHLHAVVAFPMFDKVDDSNYGLTFSYLNLLVSTVATIAWSLTDRNRLNYEKLYQWLRLYLRYYLAAYLFGYGFVKVFPSQFQAISASRLSQTVGDQTPMLLAWNFMGYSAVMMRINGTAEVIAGLLLLFRRTTLIGAILSAAVFSFVVMMDFCFNVPVRLLASHLLMISLLLILEDRRKLLNAFILNRPFNSTEYLPLITRSPWRNIFLALQVLIAVSIFYSGMTSGLKAEKEYGWNSNSKFVPLYGIYRTAYFIRNRDTILPVETDSLRWKQLVIDGGNWEQTGKLEFTSGKKILYNIKTDTVKKVISLQLRDDTTKNYQFHYAISAHNDLLIKGIYVKDSIEVLMNKYDLNNYVLYREKFQWINE